MLSKNTIYTIGSKLVILLVNFGLVIFSTHLWGSEGRGELALVISSVSIITIFGNVFCGGTIAYHAPVIQREFLILVSLVGGILVSFSGAIIFSIFSGSRYFIPLFLISLLLSLTQAISLYWLGKNNIKNYNLINILGPVLILISLTILYFLFNKTGIETYFKAYYTGTAIVLIAGITGLMLTEKFRIPVMNLARLKNIMRYGINNEFNYLIQFLNYRLSYYFIAKMLGLAELGVFSIVVSVAEAVWIISRSMSAVHFSNVINSHDQLKNRQETALFARQSLWISIMVLTVSVLIPRSMYLFAFGNEFGEVKKFIIFLVPGIMSIAVSNLYGHYFAARGQLKILRNKSLIGLAATVILLTLLLEKYHLTGVCISLNFSYIISSAYLWYKFRKEGQNIKAGL
jgi:O-antigen/teichoic acid export membrane protein